MPKLPRNIAAIEILPQHDLRPLQSNPNMLVKDPVFFF